MMDSAQKLFRIIAFVTAIGLLIVASPARAQESTPTSSTYTPPDDIGVLEGSIVADGSSTVGPITTAAAENFSELARNVDIEVSISGTGGGFTRFCEDETDVQDASRPISDDEMANCAEGGIDYYAFEIAYDGITIVVPESNTFLTCISTESLAAIWNDEITNFNQIDPSYPDMEIELFGADTESGTYDYFNEQILGEDENGDVIEPAADYEPSSDDNVLVEGVSGTEGGLGYFGFAYYENAQDRLNAVSVTADGDMNKCVAPSADTIRSQEYKPLSRPLFVYIKASSLAENRALQEFVRYYISDASALATSTGAVDAPAEDLAASQQKVEEAIAGTAPPDSQSASTPEA